LDLHFLRPPLDQQVRLLGPREPHGLDFRVIRDAHDLLLEVALALGVLAGEVRRASQIALDSVRRRLISEADEDARRAEAAARHGLAHDDLPELLAVLAV